MNPDAVVARVEKLMRRLARRRRVRHVALGVASLDGAWSWRDATGTATVAGAPMHPTTPWLIASITKLHIAAAILQLWERGDLDLEAPVARYLPDRLASGLHVLDGVDRTSEITCTHLLGHMTGLPDWLEEAPRGGRSLLDEVLADGDRAWTFEEAVARVRDRFTPHFPPSDPRAARPRIRYSDTNFQLLMVIAQQVTGKPMADVHRELTFEPLGLPSTWLPGTARPPGAAEPATAWIGDRPFDRPLALASIGDLYSTVDDLLRFGRALFTGELFRRPETVDVMGRRFTRFGLPRSSAEVRAPGWPIEYGLGMMRFELGRVLSGGMRLPGLVGHTGSTGSWLWFCRELGLVLAGTVDQTTAAAVPFRQVPRALRGLG